MGIFQVKKGEVSKRVKWNQGETLGEQYVILQNDGPPAPGWNDMSFNLPRQAECKTPLSSSDGHAGWGEQESSGHLRCTMNVT